MRSMSLKGYSIGSMIVFALIGNFLKMSLFSKPYLLSSVGGGVYGIASVFGITPAALLKAVIAINCVVGFIMSLVVYILVEKVWGV